MNHGPTGLVVSKAITGYLHYKIAEGLVPVTVIGYVHDMSCRTDPSAIISGELMVIYEFFLSSHQQDDFSGFGLLFLPLCYQSRNNFDIQRMGVFIQMKAMNLSG